MPWVILIVVILALNVPKSYLTIYTGSCLFPINGLTADGSPIATRFLWNAYTWIFVSIILVYAYSYDQQATQLKEPLKVWWKRAPRPVFSAAIFFAIGEVMNMSGFNMCKKSLLSNKYG